MSGNQLRRIERLEKVTGPETAPTIHCVHFVAPSEAGPVVVGAYGPIVPGWSEVKPVMIKRGASEAEAAFLSRAALVADRHIG